MKINPSITQAFVGEIIRQSKKGMRRIEFEMGPRSIRIDIFPNVFPPQADNSISSKCLFETFGDLRGTVVADIGCGTGIASIMAVLCGATHVYATDISQNACACAKHNVDLNNFGDKISVYCGDLFSGLPREKKYNLIIANLPIVDFRPEVEDEITAALYDPELELHRRLFSEGRNYLAQDGEIVFVHANLQSKGGDNPQTDFERLEYLIMESGYQIIEKLYRDWLGYQWVSYRIKLANAYGR